jgi:hypothetical protein
VGQFGDWTPIGAIQLSGGSTTLENYETTFHRDLNGDGTIGIAPATSPGGVQPLQTMFNGKTLTPETPTTFNGQLIGFTGDGTLAGSDQIDLHGLKFDAFHSSFDNTSGTLSASSGSSTASLQFLGQYSQNSFQFTNDGNGGTPVVAATGADQNTNGSLATSHAAHDNFVFAENFGKISLPNFAPATDTLQFNKTVFTDITALLAATHDDTSGNAIITDVARDTITLLHVTTAQLLAHQSDFHFV